MNDFAMFCEDVYMAGRARSWGQIHLSRRIYCGLLPKGERFPVVRCAHAAKNEGRRGFEQGSAALFPLGFGTNDFHTVGAKRKNREGRGVGEAWLAFKTFRESGEFRAATYAFGYPGLGALVPESGMVGAYVTGILECHENSDEDARSYKECVRERLLNHNWQPLVIKGYRTHWHMFHHDPYRGIVGNVVFSRQMLDVGGIFGFADSICYVRKKLRVLLFGDVWKTGMFRVCERIAINSSVELHNECADGNFYSRQCVHCHKPEMAVKSVYVPNGGKGCACAVVVGVLRLERNKVAGQSVISDSIKYMDQCGFVCDKPTRNKQVGKCVVVFRCLVESRMMQHECPPIKRMPAETIGRSLSGGVTEGIVPNIFPWRKGVVRQTKEAA